VRQLTGWNWLVKYRRVFGLVMFAYTTAHLATYAALDLELQLGEVAAEIVKRPYLVVGFAAWLLLVPLASRAPRERSGASAAAAGTCSTG
jgi:sulfoxide reductase heme-binding subunit YedZ